MSATDIAFVIVAVLGLLIVVAMALADQRARAEFRGNASRRTTYQRTTWIYRGPLEGAPSGKEWAEIIRASNEHEMESEASE